jgi:hypothetical protein
VVNCSVDPKQTLTDFLCQDHQDQGCSPRTPSKVTVMVCELLEKNDTTPPVPLHDRAGKPPPVAVSVVPLSLGAVEKPDVPSELTVSVVQELPSPHTTSWSTMSNGEDGALLPLPWPPLLPVQPWPPVPLQPGDQDCSDCPGISATSSKPKPTAVNVR